MSDAAPPARVEGRGLLVLVVGPSGAGKDSLIAAARAALPGGAHVFARRVVTRVQNSFEDHDSATPGDFNLRLARGEFGLHWRAHGLDYALPATIDAAIAQGKTVVANVSRAVVAQARLRYGTVRVVYVDADPGVLAARLAGRSRDADVAARLARRTAGLAPGDADVVIDNSGELAAAAAAFIRALR